MTPGLNQCFPNSQQSLERRQSFRADVVFNAFGVHSATFSEMPSERKKAVTVSCRCLHSSASLCPASVKKMAR